MTEQEAPSLCRWCKKPIEPCAKGWHDDVCHYHSLVMGDYLCGTWIGKATSD